MKRGKGRPKGSGEKYEFLGVRISDEQKEKLKKYAEQQGINMSEAVARLINGLDVEPEEP